MDAKGRFGWLWAAVAAAAGLVAVAVLERSLAIRACGGAFVYPIDDTYIHMAMAKTLAQHGVWGVEPGRLAFCSSSPLWTLLLGGCYFAVGVVDALPWFLALGFNIAALAVVCAALGRLGAGFWLQFGGAAAVAAAGPFLCTTALGMEHAMHAFFVLCAVCAAARIAEGRRGLWIAAVCAAAATASRYESLFLLGPLAAGLCGLEAFGRWRRKERLFPWRSVAFGLAAVLPVFAYGFWAVSQGGHFLPNSLLLKGSFRTVAGTLRELFLLLGSVKPDCGFLYLLAISLVVAGALPRVRTYWRVAAGAAAVAIVAQLLFADVGQLCRYEAYLTSVGAFIVLCAVISAGGVERTPFACAAIGVFCLAAGVFLLRAQRSLGEAVRSSSDICHQQVLMTRLMNGLPEADRGCVALNDLGYMALYGTFPVVDLWGLGSQDVAEQVIRHPCRWDPDEIAETFRAHDVRYVVVFEEWFPRRVMPEGVVDVAKLILKDNFACGSDTVVFRATSEDAADRLARHLERQAERMPERARLRILR